jgi:hypothetical protein
MKYTLGMAVCQEAKLFFILYGSLPSAPRANRVGDPGLPHGSGENEQVGDEVLVVAAELAGVGSQDGDVRRGGLLHDAEATVSNAGLVRVCVVQRHSITTGNRPAIHVHDLREGQHGSVSWAKPWLTVHIEYTIGRLTCQGGSPFFIGSPNVQTSGGGGFVIRHGICGESRKWRGRT